MMRELIAEHVYARKKVNNLEKAKESFVKGEVGSISDTLQLMIDLVEFYPTHINKEDKRFFYSSTEYFSQKEQKEMLQEFWEFDRNLVHAKYQQVTERMENISAGAL
jgi:hemerythrin-like domain-containing protein